MSAFAVTTRNNNGGGLRASLTLGGRMDEFSEEDMQPLTRAEIAQVRKSLKRDAITEATFVVLGKIALWITAIAGAYFAGKNFILELLK